MRVLGIDCGSRVTGYGVIDTDGADCIFVRCGVIRSKATDPIANRLKTIYDGIFEVITRFPARSGGFRKSVLCNQCSKRAETGARPRRLDLRGR